MSSMNKEEEDTVTATDVTVMIRTVMVVVETIMIYCCNQQSY